jgi:hypothetical protein
VLLRGLLALPLGVVIIFIGIATEVVVFIGWFGALFTGRAPGFTRDMVSMYLRMQLRLNSYTYLLTDRFPPFATEDVPDYPARVAVPEGTALNRWAVFFRIILVVPAWIVNAAINFGLAVLAFFLWVITLVTGWLPASAHQSIGAVLRYSLRAQAYLFLLVPTYPAALFQSNRLGALAQPGRQTTAGSHHHSWRRGLRRVVGK